MFGRFHPPPSLLFTLMFFFRADFDREDEDPEYKPARMPFKDEIDVSGRR